MRSNRVKTVRLVWPAEPPLEKLGCWDITVLSFETKKMALKCRRGKAFLKEILEGRLLVIWAARPGASALRGLAGFADPVGVGG